MKNSNPLDAIPLPIPDTTSIAREAGNGDCSLAEVRQAMAHDWGVHVDAYLVRGARVGDRYAATAYFAWGGEKCDVPPCEHSFETPAGGSKRLFGGMTVATRSVREIGGWGAFKLLRTLEGDDCYVLVSELSD